MACRENRQNSGQNKKSQKISHLKQLKAIKSKKFCCYSAVRIYIPKIITFIVQAQCTLEASMVRKICLPQKCGFLRTCIF